MNIEIFYATRYGFTQNRAEEIHRGIGTDISTLKELRGPSSPDPAEIIIIGFPIIMGRPPKEVITFLRNQKEKLKKRKLFFFVSAGEENQIPGVLNKFIPREITPAIIETAHVGFGYYLSKMNFLHRLIIKVVTGNKGDTEEVYTAPRDRLIKRVKDMQNGRQ
ncbi:MAG: flavodoxin domain-containing protein [Fibrobacterota bacterium]